MNEDRLYYRVKVGSLIQNNPIKYPASHEAIELSVINGTFAEFVLSMSAVMDSCFNENMPIAECARRIEEVCKKSKEATLMVIAMLSDDPNEKVH